MIDFYEAQRLVREHVKPGRIVIKPLLDSLGLALVRPVTARADSPRFDVSAVDGYAVLQTDFANGLPITLPVSSTIYAGQDSRKKLRPGTADRILTGAEVPTGADAIVMQEEVTAFEEGVTFLRMPERSAYIRKRGGELKRGDRLFDSGTIITPAVAQSLAACGCARVHVHQRPLVSVIVTGNELKSPGSKLGGGEIWDSNSIGLVSALGALGIGKVQTRNVPDKQQSTTRAVRAALERSDVVIATGGVSVGDRDYVKEALEANGVKEIFWRVSMRPGMPIYFGIKRQRGKTKYVFGLPGNPVSVMVTFQLFVRPALLRMMGYAQDPPMMQGILATPIKKSISRTEFVRASRNDGYGTSLRVTPLAARESYMTTSMAKADCLIVFPADRELLEAGSEVEIIPIRWTPY
jgi:molybdopterin molybdotransferase